VRRRPGDTDRFELSDVLVTGRRIAAGPAGNDGLLNGKRQWRRATLGVDDREGKIKHGWLPPFRRQVRRYGGPLRPRMRASIRRGHLLPRARGSPSPTPRPP